MAPIQPIKVHRLLRGGRWVQVPEREWWTASETADIWHVSRRHATRVVELPGPDQFVPPREYR